MLGRMFLCNCSLIVHSLPALVSHNIYEIFDFLIPPSFHRRATTIHRRFSWQLLFFFLSSLPLFLHSTVAPPLRPIDRPHTHTHRFRHARALCDSQLGLPRGAHRTAPALRAAACARIHQCLLLVGAAAIGASGARLA